tara:strand:- start:812 stop:1093 length:282 start_codon:yes stop_codon:yes gene_type:complete
MAIKISRKDGVALLKNSNGLMVGTDFIKKNGDDRKLNGRLGVKKHLKGGELKYNPSDYGLMTIFDVQKKEYRMVNLETLYAMRIQGVEYEILD